MRILEAVLGTGLVLMIFIGALSSPALAQIIETNPRPPIESDPAPPIDPDPAPPIDPDPGPPIEKNPSPPIERHPTPPMDKESGGLVGWQAA